MDRIERIPRTPLNLYINLYCTKRQLLNKNLKKDRKLLKEATKSWLSLSDTEKQAFISKHDVIIAEYKQQIADSLKNVKPYLRKKNCKQSENNNTRGIHGPDQSETNLNSSFERIPQNNNTIPCADGGDKIMSEVSLSETLQIPSNTNEGSNVNQPVMPVHFPEPIPPSVISGKELFLLLSTNTENCRNWESLLRHEKRYYQEAVFAIKRNYIKSYRSFLESLGPKELYKYYINNKDIE